MKSTKNRTFGTSLVFLILFIGISVKAHAVMEISAEFGYKKYVYGAQEQNDSISRSYSGSWAWYLFNLTALELNYYQNEQITTERDERDSGVYDVSVINVHNSVQTRVYGIGVKQALGSRKSRITPMISLGYAKQFIEYAREYTYQQDSTGETAVIDYPVEKTRDESVFASFSLKLRVTKNLALQGSVKSIFPAFEFDKASNNLKYLIGFSCIF